MVVWVQSAIPYANLPAPVAQVGTPPVTIDAIATASGATGVQTISLNMTVGATANAMLISQHFSYSGHTNFVVTWTVGGTTQTFNAGAGTATFDFILTSDNGAAHPAMALIGLLSPTPGAGTLTMSFTSAVDDLVMHAVTFNNVENLGRGISGAFQAAFFGTGTSNSATTSSVPAISGGIQCAFAGGVSNAPTTWNTGTQLYSTSSGGTTWGSGVYKTATGATTFSLGIGASVFWDAAWCVVNPQNKFSVSPSLNGSNPLTAGLLYAIPCLAAGTLTDLVTSNTATTAGGITTDTSGGFGGGIAVPGNSTTAKADFGAIQFIPNADFTIIILANPISNATRFAMLGQADSVPNNYIDILANSNNASTANVGFMSGSTFNGTTVQGVDDGGRTPANGTIHVGLIDGRYHCWGFRVASGVPSLWSDGANVTVNTVNITGTITNGSQHYAIGNLGNFVGSAFSAGCSIALSLGFNTALSDVNMVSITANPFQVLK